VSRGKGRETFQSLTVRLSDAEHLRLWEAASKWGDYGPARVRRRLALGLGEQLRAELAGWQRVDAHLPPRELLAAPLPAPSARTPERRAAFRAALRLRAAQAELACLVRYCGGLEGAGLPEELPLALAAGRSAARLGWLACRLERALSEVEP
jgi:hypothetical protein